MADHRVVAAAYPLSNGKHFQMKGTPDNSQEVHSMMRGPTESGLPLQYAASAHGLARQPRSDRQFCSPPTFMYMDAAMRTEIANTFRIVKGYFSTSWDSKDQDSLGCQP